jgi:hypothetical protein
MNTGSNIAPDQLASDDGRVRVFIAYDFEIGGMLPSNLMQVEAKPPEGYLVKWPGSPNGRTQGAIWKNIVQPEISRCDRLLAFVDLPNANVGFEVGYGLGLGKMVALARLSPDLAPWLRQAPLHGFLCPQLEVPSTIRVQVSSSAKDWIQLDLDLIEGSDVLVLCPAKAEAFLEVIPPTWGWRTLPKAEWDINNVPALLNGVGMVIWVIAPHNEGAAGRDGSENAALSLLAGFAEARPEIDLRVLRSKNARVVVDIVASGAAFSTPNDFLRCIEAIKAEWGA